MKNNITILEERIRQLEIQRDTDLLALKQQLETTYESLMPVHLLSDFIESNFGSNNLKSTLFKTGISTATSFLISKLLFKKKNSFMRNITSTAIQVLTYKFAKKILNNNN